jgi:predicted GNAT superfamily acetyltransferase
MLGVTVGFCAAPVGTSLHAHVAGGRHAAVGRGIGAAMKLHQRLWCLEHGLTRMTWTFDPLIARNAHFNIARLGARLVDYHEDFYGQMRDGVNAGQASDRAFVDWDLTDARPNPVTDPDAEAVAAVRIDDDGRPQELDVPREAPVVAIEIPSDIETLRATDPRLAAQWREAVRRGFVELLADGWRVSGFRRSGAYLLTHP